MVIGGIGILVSLCSVLAALGAIKEGLEEPIPEMLCLGVLCISGPAMMLVGLSAMERPWNTITAGLEAFRHRAGSNKTLVKGLNLAILILVIFGGIFLIRDVIPLLFSEEGFEPAYVKEADVSVTKITNSNLVIVIAVTTSLAIGFVLAGFRLWISREDNTLSKPLGGDRDARTDPQKLDTL